MNDIHLCATCIKKGNECKKIFDDAIVYRCDDYEKEKK